jgi:hypothetical protein
MNSHAEMRRILFLFIHGNNSENVHTFCRDFIIENMMDIHTIPEKQ